MMRAGRATVLGAVLLLVVVPAVAGFEVDDGDYKEGSEASEAQAQAAAVEAAEAQAAAAEDAATHRRAEV